MRRVIVVLAAALGLAAVAARVSAADVRLSVSDLAVHSDNPQYRYVGKGLAEMIAVELRKSPDITLIEREKRTALVEELAFSLGDLADAGRQAQLGRMLAAAYMVFGDLVDMGTEVLISLRMVEVQSAQIVWSDSRSLPLSRYDAIAGGFAVSILGHFGAAVSPATAARAAGAAAKDPRAAIALSTAIDLYDRDQRPQARQQLEQARALDPDSEAAEYFWVKLAANTTRFKVLMEQYYSYLNPAFLGIMQQDMLHVAANTGVFPIVTHVAVQNVNYESFGVDKSVSEMDFNVRLGYALPLGRGWGLRVEVLPTVGSLNRAWEGEYDSGGLEVDVPRTAAGAVVDAGFALGERAALGFGVGIYSHSVSDRGPVGPYTDPDRALLAFNAGILYRNPQQTLIFDTRLGYTSETYGIIDPDTLAVTEEVKAPVYLENTLTLNLQGGQTFLIVKQIDSVSLDRPYAFLTLMPAVERFLAPWLSLRAGLEGSFARLEDTARLGYGLLAGVSFRSPLRGWDADLNVSWRQRPSRVVEGLLYTDFTALVNVTWSGLRAERP